MKLTNVYLNHGNLYTYMDGTVTLRPEDLKIIQSQLLHNGGNDSQKRQSQLWNQILCQTKTAKNFLWNWLVILMSCNSLTNFEYEEAFAKPELLKFGKKTSLP